MSKREVWVLENAIGNPCKTTLTRRGVEHATNKTYGNTVVRYVPESTQPAERDGEWVSMVKPDGTFAVDEGQTYLFAIEVSTEVSTNGCKLHWEYFVDAVVWDAETDPDWSSGEHGWDINDEILFRPIAPPQPKGTK